MSQFRDSFVDLFEKLLADRTTESDADPDGDRRAAIRLLGNALANYASVAGPDRLATLEDTLPWLNFFAQQHRRQDLEGRDKEELSDAVFRAARRMTLLEKFETASDSALCDRLYSETDAARVALRASGPTGQSASTHRFPRLLPALHPRRRAATRIRALRILSKLESGDASALSSNGAEFDESTRSFEISLTDTMVRQGMGPAVRAALLLAPDSDEANVQKSLIAAPVFREDSELRSLASTLASMRGKCFDYLRGEASFAELSAWVDYLTDDTERFAERREISTREAVSYAHYSFHLVNLCDAAARRESGLSKQIRDGLLAVEDELKEMALNDHASRREASAQSAL